MNSHLFAYFIILWSSNNRIAQIESCLDIEVQLFKLYILSKTSDMYSISNYTITHFSQGFASVINAFDLLY